LAKKRRTAKRRTTARKIPKSRTAARKRPVAKKKNRAMERWIFTVIIVIVLFALLFSMPSGNNGIDNGLEDSGAGWQEQTQETTTEVQHEYTCKNDFECFLANCKSMPDVVECVNVAGQENYYENCEAYWDVNIVQDFTKCACVDGVCK
jgi:hypothetical protein